MTLRGNARSPRKDGGGKSNNLGVKTQDGFLLPSPTRSPGGRSGDGSFRSGHSPGYTPRSPGSPNSRQSTMSNKDGELHHTVYSREDILALPDDASTRFDLFEEIGQGTYGLVHRAIDNTTRRDVAIKIVENIEQNLEEVLQEYQILSDHSLHPNIPQLFGAHRCGGNIWFALELCSGGPASELARQLVRRGRRLIDEQIAYIIKEVLHALIYLQESQCIHRDVKGSNILLTDNAEVKLVDFGISCQLQTPEEKRRTRVGTPYWMAPEVVLSGDPDVYLYYDGTEGEPPLSHLQPMRALMQIPKNPPPRLSHPEEWSVALNDIIQESLIKDFDHRPMLQGKTFLKSHFLINQAFSTYNKDDNIHKSEALKR